MCIRRIYALELHENLFLIGSITHSNNLILIKSKTFAMSQDTMYWFPLHAKNPKCYDN